MVYSDQKSSKKEDIRPKVRIPHLLNLKGKNKISAVTCYDATFARLIESSPIDIVLVGDSLGHVIQGLNSTLTVTVEDVCYHTRAVARALHTAHLVADMPFGTAGLTDDVCFHAATMLMRAGAESVKIEGSSPEIIAQIGRLVRQGIPVMGHLGLTPQSVHALGGYRIQGKSESQITDLISSAKDLQEAGCYAIVLELCTAQAAKLVTDSLEIPTIGIGSGAHCDGQILVLQDMLGMNLSFRPKFLKHFEKLEEKIALALHTYDTEVKSGFFPAPESQTQER